MLLWARVTRPNALTGNGNKNPEAPEIDEAGRKEAGHDDVIDHRPPGVINQ